MGGKHPQPASRRGHSNTKEARVREAAQFNRVVSEGPTRLLESRSVCWPSGYNLLHYFPLSRPLGEHVISVPLVTHTGSGRNLSIMTRKPYVSVAFLPEPQSRQPKLGEVRFCEADQLQFRQVEPADGRSLLCSLSPTASGRLGCGHLPGSIGILAAHEQTMPNGTASAIGRTEGAIANVAPARPRCGRPAPMAHH